MPYTSIYIHIHGGCEKSRPDPEVETTSPTSSNFLRSFLDKNLVRDFTPKLVHPDPIKVKVRLNPCVYPQFQ